MVEAPEVPVWLFIVSAFAGGLTVSLDPGLAGEALRVEVTGAPADRPIALFLGTEGAGPGACPGMLRGACLGLLGRPRRAASGPANALGRARFSVATPPTPGAELCVQAAGLPLAGPAFLSPAVCVVLDGDSDGDGVPDSEDACIGDDRIDGDRDGVPDACDPCPEDAPDDPDGDGACGWAPAPCSDDGDEVIRVDELNTCLAALGAEFSEVEYIEVEYGFTDYLDAMCASFGYGTYLEPFGADECGGFGPGAFMYPSYCGYGWLGAGCYNGCGNDNYPGFVCRPRPEDRDRDGVLTPEDCDDGDPTIYPGAPEICGDGIDQDCVGGDVFCPGDESCIDPDGDRIIRVADLNLCLEGLGAEFSEVQYIEVAYGFTEYLDEVCDRFGYGPYLEPWGDDLCDGFGPGAYMYPSYCGFGWLGAGCYNGCGNDNYPGFVCL
ncbi:MAG: hypothetical protein ACI8PZ_005165 [Myxococcota bacterium]|jgi:hypothetical protein